MVKVEDAFFFANKLTCFLVDHCGRHYETILLVLSLQNFFQQEAETLQRVLKRKALKHLNVILVPRQDYLPYGSLEKDDVLIADFVKACKLL